MLVRQITSRPQLEELGASWNELAGGVPFRSYDWLDSWWRHYGPGHRLLVLTVEEKAGRLIGLAPWYVDSSAWHGRVIKPLGSGEVYSEYVSLFCQPGCEDDVAAALADHLHGEHGRRWDLLYLPNVDADDSAAARLAEYLQRQSAEVDYRAADRCWRIELAGSWEEYLATHSKSHRKQLRRFQSRVLESGRAVLHLAEDDAGLDRGWEVLVDLHQRRRAQLDQPGCFASPRYAAFHREASRRLLADGRLRLYWLELDGRPIAAEYQLAGDRGIYAYQAGVDPERLDEQPGQLITIATIQRAIDEGRQFFDLLRGDEPYKAHWRAHPYPAYDYRITSGDVSAQLRRQLRRAAEGVKGWIKGGLCAVAGSHA